MVIKLFHLLVNNSLLHCRNQEGNYLVLTVVMVMMTIMVMVIQDVTKKLVHNLRYRYMYKQM